MISVQSVLYALVLFSKLSSHLAMPATKAEDAIAEPDGLLGDEPMSEPAVVPPAYRRGLMLEENGSPSIIIISDVGLKGHSIRDLKSAFTRSLPQLTAQSSAPTEHALQTVRRNADIDVLRCMIGRVYRPCWEI